MTKQLSKSDIGFRDAVELINKTEKGHEGADKTEKGYEGVASHGSAELPKKLLSAWTSVPVKHEKLKRSESAGDKMFMADRLMRKFQSINTNPRVFP